MTSLVVHLFISDFDILFDISISTFWFIILRFHNQSIIDNLTIWSD